MIEEKDYEPSEGLKLIGRVFCFLSVSTLLLGFIVQPKIMNDNAFLLFYTSIGAIIFIPFYKFITKKSLNSIKNSWKDDCAVSFLVGFCTLTLATALIVNRENIISSKQEYCKILHKEKTSKRHNSESYNITVIFDNNEKKIDIDKTDWVKITAGEDC